MGDGWGDVRVKVSSYFVLSRTTGRCFYLITSAAETPIDVTHARKQRVEDLDLLLLAVL